MSTRVTLASNENGKQSTDAPATYFLSLTLENIRCFGPEQTLDLSDGKGGYAPWTIILGDNGFGKTTLLQCFAYMQPTELKSHSSDESMVISPMLRQLPDYFSIFRSIARNYPAIISCSFISVSRSRNTVTSFPGMRSDSRDLIGTGFCDPDESDRIKDLTCYGYGASRRLGTGNLTSPSGSDNTGSLFQEDVALINAEEWFLQTDYSNRISPSEHAIKYQERIKQALIRLLPSVDDIRIAENKELTPPVRVEVKTPFGWVHIQSLSLGYRTLIAWVVDLAKRLFERYPDSENPLAEPAVVLVDEIDLHLHPRFQRILMDYLTELFPRTQFIATAHSPLVVQAASNANIALLRRVDDYVVIDNDVESIAKWRIDQILTSELFGLESARPPQQEALLKERTRLLSKSRLTKQDQARLKELEEQIGELPTGETPQDIEAMDIIRQAAALLKEQEVTTG